MHSYKAPTDNDIIELILAHEGGAYTNDPADSGGPTKWGITMPVLSAYLGRNVSARDIQMLTREMASSIYRQRFVLPFAKLPDPVRVNVIDMGVNAGTKRATILLQQTVGAQPDGLLGPETYRLAAARDWNPLYVGVRLAFYEDLIVSKPLNIKWRNGWRNRALSFYVGIPTVHLAPRRRGMHNQPIYGFMGKAA